MKTRGMNKHQKAAHKRGEQRVGRDEIPELLKLSESEDPEDRLTAAEHLCPCHVRKRIEPVWRALFRMMENPDVRVRRAAWHTLEDGGRPNDPALDVILDRVLKNDPDAKVRRIAEHASGGRRERDLHTTMLLGRGTVRQKGRCDFCGENNLFVERDYATTIPTGSDNRLALICEGCVRTLPAG
ncbi:MAG: HEAT repeat domain-containing protein [Armatimonadota bacterium]|nr:HEAT repeat domain-containing protein [Armatimonadota bacterium]